MGLLPIFLLECNDDNQKGEFIMSKRIADEDRIVAWFTNAHMLKVETLWAIVGGIVKRRRLELKVPRIPIAKTDGEIAREQALAAMPNHAVNLASDFPEKEG